MSRLKPIQELFGYLLIAGAVLLVGWLAGWADRWLASDQANLLALVACAFAIALSLSYLRRTGLYFRELRAREKAQVELRKLHSAVEQSPTLVIIWDVHNVIEYANAAFCEHTGYTRDELVGQPVSRFPSRAVSGALQAEIRTAIDSGEVWRGELHVDRKNGEQLYTSATLSPLVDVAGRRTHVLAMYEDISNLISFRERLFQQTNFDALTGLPNRALAMDRLTQAINSADRHERPLTLMTVDVDRFKMVNESLGHQFGDQLLNEAARRLQQSVRDEDTVARLGGDEFLVLLVNQRSSRDASLVAEKLLQSMAQAFVFDGREFNVSASIGITVYPEDGNNAEELLRNADAALHQAKLAGRNSFQFFTPRMNSQALLRLTMETELRHAIDRDQLELHYQPLVDLDSGELIGAECLLRWHNLELGNPSPMDFIPVAEESGLIIPIGRWVLREACLQAVRWQLQGLPPIRVAVNISSRQFVGGSVLSAVQHALEASGLTPGLLELEITEGLLLDDAPQTRRIISMLKKIGVRLSLDDFGTGYSSLSYLKRYPFDALKIDRTFINDIGNDPGDANLAATIIAMGDSLGLEVIGEGIETDIQLDALRSRGCQLGQGYLFSPPLPATGFQAWWMQHRQPAAMREVGLD